MVRSLDFRQVFTNLQVDRDPQDQPECSLTTRTIRTIHIIPILPDHLLYVLHQALIQI